VFVDMAKRNVTYSRCVKIKIASALKKSKNLPIGQAKVLSGAMPRQLSFKPAQAYLLET
jgi:hypothetical protein